MPASARRVGFLLAIAVAIATSEACHPAPAAPPASSGAPFVWVCTPVTFANAGGGARVDLDVFNASSSSASVAVNLLDVNGVNLAGVTVPGAMPVSTYPGDTGTSTVAVAAAHTRRVTWLSPSSSPDPTTNVVYSVRVTSDQPIGVGAFMAWSGFVQLPCSFVPR
jgi:hypothetical protein